MSRKRDRQGARPPRQPATPAKPPDSPGWNWRRDGVYAALAFVLTFGAFANSLTNGFVYDDGQIIRDNPRLERWWDLPTLFGTSYWDVPTRDLQLYRPLTIMSFAVDRAVLGPGPFGVHLMNVLANALIAVLVYGLAWRLTQRRGLALAVALLFGLHPVHTEVVANGVGRAELYAMLAVLGSAHLHLTHVRGTIGPTGTGPAGRVGRLGCLVGALALYLVALLFKESAIVLPGLLLLMEWLVLRAGRVGAMLPRIGAYALYALPLGVYLAARLAVVGFGSPAAQEVMADASTLQRVLYVSETTWRYLGQLTLPLWLCAEYADYTTLIQPTLATPVTLAALVAWLGAAAVIVWLVRRRQWLLLFGLAWFGLALLPVSNLLVPIGTVRADRLLFLPSLGFVLVLAQLVADLARRQRVAGVALLIALLALYGWRTVTRNRVWHDQTTFWTVTARQNPGSALAALMAGVQHEEAGDFAAAEQAYQRAWELRDGAGFFYKDAHLKYAIRLQQRNERQAAAQRYRLVLERFPDDPTALVNLGQLLFGDDPTRAEAIQLLQRAVAIQPDDHVARFYLGLAYRRDGQRTVALQEVDAAIALHPEQPDYWGAKALRLRELGHESEAAAAQQQAQRLHRRP
jgi:tetratricopeptide (TPR) repeat protein